jgi:tetratricopeptide (TPR) repeat protein
MMKDQFDHIEEYLRGELSPEEQASFESSLEEDSELREKVEIHRKIRNGIEMGFNKELKDLLIEEESKLPRPKDNDTNRIRTLYPIIGVAAAISLLIIAFFTLRTENVDNSELFAEYYQPYPNVEAPISRSEDNESNPYALYEKGAYAEALNQFSEIQSINFDEPAIIFYAAICQLELGLTDDSISSFKQLLELEANKYTRPAKWYLALVYLKSDQSSQAISYLNELTTFDDVYAKRAIQILSEVEK